MAGVVVANTMKDYINQMINDFIAYVKQYQEKLMNRQSKLQEYCIKSQKQAFLIFVNVSLQNLFAMSLHFLLAGNGELARESIYKPGGVIETQLKLSVFLSFSNNI